MSKRARVRIGSRWSIVLCVVCCATAAWPCRGGAPYDRDRYDRVPIVMANPTAAPSDEDVLSALERGPSQQGDVLRWHNGKHGTPRIAKQRVADYLDPPRVFPLIGLAKVHHVQYRCTVKWTELHPRRRPAGRRWRAVEMHKHIDIDRSCFCSVNGDDSNSPD